jgi:MYXO-CTERM domain-containing protein
MKNAPEKNEYRAGGPLVDKKFASICFVVALVPTVLTRLFFAQHPVTSSKPLDKWGTACVFLFWWLFVLALGVLVRFRRRRRAKL